MEIRYLQKTGGSSYTVTIPKRWITKHKLNPKDQVETYILKNGQLTLWPVKENRQKKAIMEIDYLTNEQIGRELVAHYISGVEEIIVRARTISYEQRSLVRSISYKLIGFEQFEGTSNEIVLRNFSSGMLFAPEFVHNMMEIIISMYADMCSILLKADRNMAKDIIERDVEVDRIHIAIMRQFNKLLYFQTPLENSDLSVIDVHYYSHIAIRLERIADHIVRIAETIVLINDSQKLRITRPEINGMNRTSKYLTRCQQVINSIDKRTAHQVLNEYESTKKNEFINKKIMIKRSINILLEDSLERIRGYVANIAEETIDYSNIKTNYNM